MEQALIVEDDPLAAAFACYALAPLRLAVQVTPTARQACAVAEHHPLALALLDVDLPDASGFDVCRWLRATQPHMAILLCSGSADVAARQRGLAHGADDYLSKPLPSAEMAARARLALTQHAPPSALPVSPIERGAFRLPDGRVIELTPTEARILALLLARPGVVVPLAEIARRLWGAERDALAAQRALDAHLRRLRAKLEHDPLHPRLLWMVRGVGVAAALRGD